MLYVTGDTHGDYERFTSSALKKLKKGDTLFICGDFGFIWDGSKNEEKLLKKISNTTSALSTAHTRILSDSEATRSRSSRAEKSIISPATSIILCAARPMTSTA